MGTKSRQKDTTRQKAINLDLKRLKPYLRRNDIKEAAKEVGITREWASEIMSGRAINWEFIENITERARRNKEIKTKVDQL
jgi:hypothetical protein